MTTPYYTDERVTLHHGDCLDVLAAMPDASVDAIVTDPPYSLTDRREQYCAGDVLRDAIVTDAQHGDAERAKSLVTLRITVAPALAVRVRGVDLDGDVAAGEEEVDNDGAPGRQDDDMLMNEGHAVAGEERLSGTFRLWVRKGSARCIGACRCLGQHGDGLIRVPVRLRNDSLGESERTPGIVALGGAELAAVLALDVARGTGELLPASGADTLDQPFELLCPEFVGAGAGARRLASVAESSGVGGVGAPADRALSFDLVAHRAVLSWRPTVLRGFMSSLWDGTGVETDTRLWRECLRVLKPGGHCLAFGSPRTWHNLQTAIEKSGFELRDSIAWLYGSGFPKSLDVSKAIDKAAGAEREVIGLKASNRPNVVGQRPGDSMGGGNYGERVETAPATPDAERWQGWGTALKPAFEPVVVARKPLEGTVASNVLTWGTGALNIDATRVATTDSLGGGANKGMTAETRHEGFARPWMRDDEAREAAAARSRENTARAQALGRWPANVVLDESQAAALDEQSGETVSREGKRNAPKGAGTYGAFAGDDPDRLGHADSGGASRFFYIAKAASAERPKKGGIAHPTVKPLDLMRWLVRLVTPPGGLVLDPFAGSGTTLEAAIVEGFRCIGIEREADYLPLIDQRIARAHPPLDFTEATA